jgi:hypothetical protein
VDDDREKILQRRLGSFPAPEAPCPGSGRGLEGSGLLFREPVFLDHGLDGMSCDLDRLFALGKAVLEDLHMYFAEPLHLFDGHSPVDQRLFHGGYFSCAHALDELGEFALHFAHGASRMQFPYYFLEFYLTPRIDALIVAHGFLLPCL